MEKVNLKVVKAARGHTGKYEMVVENSRGSVKVPIKITVVDKPSAPRGPLELTDIYAEHTTVNWKPPEVSQVIERRWSVDGGESAGNALWDKTRSF